MTKRKVVDKDMDQQARVAMLADKYYCQLKKEGVTIEELGKILYRIRKVAAASAKI